MKNLSILALLLTFLFLANSCNEDDDPIPLKPNLTFPDGTTVSVERGKTINVNINISAPGEVKSFTAGGEDLNYTVDANDKTKATAVYTFTAEENEAFGIFCT